MPAVTASCEADASPLFRPYPHCLDAPVRRLPVSDAAHKTPLSRTAYGVGLTPLLGARPNLDSWPCFRFARQSVRVKSQISVGQRPET